MIDYQSLCAHVCSLARRAGHYIASQREGFSFDKVEFKGAQNMVSYVDKSAEEMIVDGLRELLPRSGFITEEGTARDRGESLRWIVDPLDGTTNFIHGLPPYCVSIALADGPELVLGVVYEITLGETFCAWKGSDAFLNGKKITASTTSKVENSLIAIGFSYASEHEIENFQRQVALFQRSSNGVRRLGSATADIVYVACGRFDAFAQTNLQPWDVAAGALIAQRAGALVSDYDGGQDYIFGRSFVAAAPGIYHEFMPMLRQTLDR